MDFIGSEMDSEAGPMASGGAVMVSVGIESANGNDQRKLHRKLKKAAHNGQPFQFQSIDWQNYLKLVFIPEKFGQRCIATNFCGSSGIVIAI
jgi:hypothetical protein